MPWPPKGWRCRKFTYYVPVVVDDATQMDESQTFVQERFPSDDEMVAVMPVPGGAVGYHLGHYGECWLTDPAKREEMYRGGMLLRESA